MMNKLQQFEPYGTEMDETLVTITGSSLQETWKWQMYGKIPVLSPSNKFNINRRVHYIKSHDTEHLFSQLTYHNPRALYTRQFRWMDLWRYVITESTDIFRSSSNTRLLVLYYDYVTTAGGNLLKKTFTMAAFSACGSWDKNIWIAKYLRFLRSIISCV